MNHTFWVGMQVIIRDTPAMRAFRETFGGPEVGRRYTVSQVIESPYGPRLLFHGLPRKIRKRLVTIARGVPATFCEPTCGCPLSP